VASPVAAFTLPAGDQNAPRFGWSWPPPAASARFHSDAVFKCPASLSVRERAAHPREVEQDVTRASDDDGDDVADRERSDRTDERASTHARGVSFSRSVFVVESSRSSARWPRPRALF